MKARFGDNCGNKKLTGREDQMQIQMKNAIVQIGDELHNVRHADVIRNLLENARSKYFVKG